MLICDKISKGFLGGLPVLVALYTFCVELSTVILLIAGKAGTLLASAVFLPPFVGLLLAGFPLKDLIHTALIKESLCCPRSTSLGELQVLASAWHWAIT